MTPADLAAANVKAVYAIAADQHGRLGGEIDELVGDGMVGLMQAAQRFDPSRFTGCFSTYARTRIIGEMVDGYRRRHFKGHFRRTSLGFPVPQEVIEPLQPPAPAAEDEAEMRDDLRRLLNRIDGLSRPLRAVVDTMLLPGQRNGSAGKGDGRMDELARREGVSPSRISQRLREARRRLAA